jgi:hypothetical protein
MNRLLLIAIAALILTGALLLAGCDSGTTRISAILNDPGKYMGKEVSIAGTITNTYDVNIVIASIGAYQVDDGTGKIWVTTENGVPSRGQKVAVKGTVAKGINLGGQSLGTIIREKDRRVK